MTMAYCQRMGSLAASGALLGAAGGVAAGAVDFAFAQGGFGLLLFLCGLYGAAGSLAGLLVGVLAGALGLATDLGALWRNAWSGESSDGGRWAAYGVAAAGALAALGLMARNVSFVALQQFHQRFLIASLVGAACAGLAIALAAAVFIVAAALTPLLRFGPRVKLRLAGAPAVRFAGWIVGLMVGAGGVTLLLLSLQKMGRMGPPLKALNTGLWAPAIMLGALVVFHVATRFVQPRAAWLRSTGGALALGALALALPLAAAAVWQWPTVRQLDFRPWRALVTALVLALSLRRVRVRQFVAYALPPLLLALALVAGRSDRVRKAASAYTGASAPLVRLIHAATDLDRDGYSSVLGGSDCDDLDRSVHPGAFDWPDDGIDQDCNGHQATLQPSAARPWAKVPSNVPKDLNVVLLTIDALRADHVGAYGYKRPTTPNLDQLARESVLFKNGWAHAPSTRYSVPAILIGRYPSTIPVGSAWWPPDVLPVNRLISEILKENGYRTAAFLPYYYFDRRWGLDQGFDDYDIHLQTLHSMGGDPAATHGSSARQLADLDVQYIQDHKNEKFFLWSHYYDTHFMFERHPEPETHFGDDELSMYDGEIRFTDIQLGRVFEALKQAGLWDKTIVIVTADHGDGFGEHGIPKNQRHGYHLYRTETKVPTLIRVPGVAPRVVDMPVGHIDLLPTLLNAIGAKDEPQLLGESVLGVMTGETPDHDRRIFQEVWYEGPTSRKAVVDEKWHLIRNLVPDDTTELYADDAEDHDLSGRGEAAETELMQALGAWMDQIAIPANFQQRVAGNVSKEPMSPRDKLGDDLGGWLAVEGVDVVTPQVKPGGDAEVHLYLHGLSEIPEGWILFTHFNGPAGHAINADHAPLEGAFPLERVKKGLWLRDKVKAHIGADWPRGPITVEVGLWRKGQRAAAKGPHSAGGAVRVATMTVTP
jgi:arylsulfatase A-like enzyme